MSAVFISYASEDKEQARRVARAIEARGFSVFWDRHIPVGRTWDDVVEAEVEKASCVVVLWSRSSVDSAWVRAEAEEGAARGVLLPVLLEEIKVPIRFRSIQAAQLPSSPSSPDAPDYTNLIEAIERLAGAPAGLTLGSDEATDATVSRGYERVRERPKRPSRDPNASERHLGRTMQKAEKRPAVDAAHRAAPGRTRRENSEHTFVARESELDRLNEFLGRAVGGAGQVCFVVGEAGSGKSALIQEFSRRAQARNKDLLVLFGDCNPQTGAGDPYLPFREILAQLSGDVDASVTEGVITQENADRLRRFLQVSRGVLVDIGADLLGLFIPGGSLLAKLGMHFMGEGAASQAGLDQNQILERYTAILRRLAERKPMIVLIDDLHWADSASIALLFHLARRIEGSRLLILGTYRPQEVSIGRGRDRHPLDPVLSELKRYYGDAWIDLESADLAEQRNLVHALVDIKPNRLDEQFRKALLLHTEGHPLFTVELLQSFQDHGNLVRDRDGKWILARPLEWEDLPTRVEGVIEARIGRLDEELRGMVSVASVEGESFTAEVVAGVRSAEIRTVVKRLSNELEKQHHLVRAQGSYRVGANRISLYRFRHNLFQKYLYCSLSPVERAYLHDDVGRTLEQLYGERAGDIAVHLAWHFSEAGDKERAAKYQEQAADTAANVYAYIEARRHYAECLDTLRELPDTVENRRRRVDLTLKLVEVGYVGDSPEQNLARLREIEPLASALPSEDGTAVGDPLRLARTQYWIGRFHFLLNAPREAIAYYRKVLEVAPGLGDQQLLALPSSVIGRALVSQGHFDKAVPLLEQALGPLEKVGNSFEWIHTMAFLGTALAARGEQARAHQSVEAALARAQQINSPTAIALCCIHRFAVLMNSGDTEATIDAARATVDAAERSGDTVALYVGLGFRGWAECENGNYPAAAASMLQCRTVGATLGARLVIADWFAVVDVAIAFGSRQFDLAITLAEKAVEMARPLGGIFAQARAYRFWAQALVASDPARWAEAQQKLYESVKAASAGGALTELARTHTVWVELSIAQGEHASALEHLQDVSHILKNGTIVCDVQSRLPALAQVLSSTKP